MIEILANDRFVMTLLTSMVAAIGMNLVYITGQLNLGQAGFLAVGAYTTAVLDAQLGWPLPATLLAGAMMAGLVALPVAVGASRVRGIYLIMGTLAVGEVVRVAISNIEAIGGLQGYSGQSPIGVGEVLATLLVVLAAAAAVMISRFGLQMRSIFDDEDAAAAIGVATRRVKVASVVLSAAVVGVSGGLLAKSLLFIAPRDFRIDESFDIALFTLIGGVHSLLGAVAGAFTVSYVLEFFRRIADISWIPESLSVLAGWRFVVYGLLVMVLMAVRPEGLVSRRHSLALTRPFREFRRRVTPAAPVDAAETPVEHAGPVLELDGISHRFDGVVAVAGVSLTVQPAEIVALIGANGAGKTTLIDVVAGRHRCQRGSIRLLGTDVTPLRPERRASAGIARTFQSVRMLEHLTVDESIRLASAAAAGRSAPAIETVLDMIGLTDRRDVLPDRLTLAEQRRLEIGRAIASSPAIIFLDEPSIGMNEEERAELGDLVRALRDLGAAVVVVDHNLDLAMRVADRAVVLDFGSVIAEGPPGEVLDDPRVRAAYLGGSALPGGGWET